VISKPVASRYNEILKIAESIGDLLRNVEGTPVKSKPTRKDLEAVFLSFSEAQQENLYQATLDYYRTCLAVITSKGSLRNNPGSVARHLARHRVRIDGNVFATLSQHQCVEIYDFQFVQTFRSPNFFNFVDHSIADFAILPYWEIFSRSAAVNDRILRNAQDILNGIHRGPMWNFVEDNIVKEKSSAKITKLHTIVCAPIYLEDSPEVVGLIHVFDIALQNEIQAVH